MATKIRLMRLGRKKRPFYRIVVADARTKRDGKYINKIGHYDPLLSKEEPNALVFDTKLYEDWISKGAIPTETAVRLYKLAKTPDETIPETEDQIEKE